jgi:hypothetical protein
MKLTQSKLRSIIYDLMTQMGLLDRPATPDEIAQIVQAALADTHTRKAKPLAPKLVVPENPDEESFNQALFTVMSPFALRDRLAEIPTCECFLIHESTKPELRLRATFAHHDQIRQLLMEFGVCPIRRKRPPTCVDRPNSHRFRMVVRLPEDWRVPSRW